MTSFDYRMVEGPPLQYTYFHPAQDRQDHLYSNYQPYSYFDRFNIFGQEDMSENYGAASPNSTEHHSDSENSISSVEVSPRREPKNEQTVCRWKSCGLGFSNLELLANHVSSQHGASGAGGLYYCGWEGCTRNQKAFNARYKMLVHVRTHTNEKPHQCFQCPKSFSRAENLKIHIRSHSGEKPYICPVVGCGKAYSNSSDRFKHSRTHQVEKPYVCKVPGCTKRYTDPSSLRKHVKTYKHFANENIEAMKAELNAVMVEKQLQPSRPFCNQDQTKGYCSQSCCLSSAKSNEILRLGNLTFYQKRDSESVWNPYESKFNFSKGGILCKNETSTDIDMPLDLSVHSH